MFVLVLLEVVGYHLTVKHDLLVWVGEGGGVLGIVQHIACKAFAED